SAGFLIGADHAMRSGDADISFGLLGGASSTQQEFQRSSNQQLLTNYVADFTQEFKGADPGYTGPTSFSYPLLDAHSINADERQRLTGPSLGLTSSFSKGGFFSDAVVKADFLTLNQTSTVSDTFNRSLTNAPSDFPPQLFVEAPEQNGQPQGAGV